ncbi:MAG: SdrD B-like domain-containing protein, partial [Anaerolineae bacterium]|nr:S8 family serine peptidase [Caldilineales bacterium]MDW8268414.1 SdrD B-like domain-containing protein [Anaerolineae bacterium]
MLGRRTSALIGILVVLAGIVGVVQGQQHLALTTVPAGSGVINGIVFFDANANGVRDGAENGMPGVSLYLISAAGHTVTTSTAGDGSYRFEGLAAGEYTLGQTVLTGFVPTTAVSRPVAVGEGVVVMVDFGQVIPRTLSGTVYDDLNGNGQQDLTEPVVAAAQIEVYDDRDGNGEAEPGQTPAATTLSDEQGNYVIGSLLPGPYVVAIRLPGGTSEPEQAPFFMAGGETGGAEPMAIGLSADGVRLSGAAPDPVNGGICAHNRVTVRFRPDVSPATVEAILQRFDLKVVRYLKPIDWYILSGPDGSARTVLRQLRRLPQVQEAVPDCLVWGDALPTLRPNDPDYNNPSLVYAPQMINAELAWDYSLGQGIIVAVADTGISMTHPEFAGRILPGYDFVNSDNDPSDDNGHGTHVTGIVAAAINNGQGIVGISPAAWIMPLKVLNDQNVGF